MSGADTFAAYIGMLLANLYSPLAVSSHRIFARVFSVCHAGCPAVGYAIGCRHKPELKPEYKGLPGHEIRDLVKSGAEIKESKEYMDVLYTGDTSIEGLLKPEIESLLPQCAIVLCEATMLEDSDEAKQLACDRGHLHIQDIAELLEKVSPKKQRWILIHISARYNAQQTLEYVADAVPKEHHHKIEVSISSLSSNGKYKRISQGGRVHLPKYTSIIIEKSSNVADESKKKARDHTSKRRGKTRSHGRGERYASGGRGRGGRGHARPST